MDRPIVDYGSEVLCPQSYYSFIENV